MAHPQKTERTTPWFSRKADWAESKAAEFREQIREVSQEQVPTSNWRGVQRKMRVLSNLRQQESDWARRASRYRAQGL